MIETAKQRRLRRVIDYIAGHPGCTTREIAMGISSEGKPVTERTIQNDLRHLREAWNGGELHSQNGRHSVALYEGFSQKGIDEQPKIFLKLAIEHLENLSDLSDEHETLLQQLNLHTLDNPFFIKPEEYEALNTDEEELKELHTAIKHDTNIAFTFQGKEYHVEPYRLVNFDGIWYLYGRDIEEKEENDHKTWILKDIDNVEVYYGEKHDTPDEEIEEELEEAYSAEFVVGERFEVRVWISPEKAAYFLLRKQFPNQVVTKQPDGSLIVTATVSTYADIDPEIKSWLPHIRVLEPLAYKERFISELRRYIESCGIEEG